MGEVVTDGTDGETRALARLVEPFHAVTYYSRELADLSGHGYRGWWHAYFGYRPAPLGPVGAEVVTSVFYNFAPRMVERAVPGVWEILAPAAAVDLRLGLVDQALGRVFDRAHHGEALAAGAALIRRAVDGCRIGARPLFAAYAALPWPDDDALALWHGCTLLREYRGDSHNLALAAADVDPVASHVLMAGRGHGNRPTILAIRGWTEDEWAVAVEGLVARGWARPDGSLTDAGSEARSDIERHTDRLSAGPVETLGPDLGDLLAALDPLVEHLKTSGEVSGRWPPEHLMKSDDNN